MVVSNTAARRRTPFRRPAAFAVAGIAAAASLLAVPTADAAGPTADTTPAASAVRALTGTATAPRLPDDFGAVTGYRPTVVDGILVAPQGSCSSPIPLPAEFDTACKAHDLGYDLLRYAQHSGHPLGGWARRDLDRALADRMLSACRHRQDPMARTSCTTLAGIAAAAVDLNSRRQGYGAPVVEHFSFAETATTWLPRVMALILAAFATFLTWRTCAGGRFGRPALRDPFELAGSRNGVGGSHPGGPASLGPPAEPAGTPSRSSLGSRGLRLSPAIRATFPVIPFRQEYA
ncbi:hypothetical protein [Nocardia flavorosea]|uniref:Phospholipase A2-like protein n=1 Tax=Nocardia flavorosea TaxID=53429 RepID=A0A846YRE6_9NOCA|nr:hypothetical protein [Nocardia flavorosea]NKY59978.1 hypothetical protein [Nocardia flavorosea]